MKKIIKITESELNRIIRKVISEQQYAQRYDKENPTHNISSGFQDLGSASFEDPEDRKPEYMKPKTPPVKTTGAVKGKSTKLRPAKPIVKQELNIPEQNT
jgi:hypothetical protein